MTSVSRSVSSPTGERSTDPRPHLLLISTGARLFREYLLASIAQQYRIHLFLAAEPEWETRYIDAVTVLADTLDAEEMISAARQLNEHDRIDGVLCWDEARIIATSKIAQALGLPGGDPDVVMGCRDKHLTRQRLAAAGVAQPRSIVVDTVEHAMVAAAEIGYPVVLKPRGIAASLGVVLAHDEAALREHFAFARDTTVPGALVYDDLAVLVEEYADGPEISIDCAVYHGQVYPICLAHKELGYPPYFEEIGHVVDGAEPMLSDPALITALEQAHAALGFTDGMTHTEYRLTPSGPKLIEVNARLGGDLIPYLGMRATGIDPGLAAAAIACGRQPQIAADRKLVGAVRFRYVPYEMTITEIGFDPGRLPDEVDLAVVQAQPGQRLAPPPGGTVWGRIAYLTAIADTGEQCRAVLDAADAALVVTGTAVDPAADTGEPAT
jgi:biotin carboxylase